MDLRAATLAVDKGGSGFPAAMTILYGTAKGSLSEDSVDWAAGAAQIVRFAPVAASGDIVGDVQILGPLYIRAGYLVAKDGANEAVCATTWAAGETITASVETSALGLMRVGRID